MSEQEVEHGDTAAEESCDNTQTLFAELLSALSPDLKPKLIAHLVETGTIAQLRTVAQLLGMDIRVEFSDMTASGQALTRVQDMLDQISDLDNKLTELDDQPEAGEQEGGCSSGTCGCDTPAESQCAAPAPDAPAAE